MSLTRALVDNDRVIKQAFEQPQWYLQKRAYNIRIRAETIKEFTKGCRAAEILDVGCGDGSLSLPILTNTNRVTFLDRSKAMLDIVSSRVPKPLSERVQRIQEDFMTAELRRAHFDLIICVGVMAYVHDRHSFAKKISATLKPGGSVVLECTDGDHFISHAVGAYGSLRRCFSAKELQTVIRPSNELVDIYTDLGFELIQSFRYSQPLPGLRRLLPHGLSYGLTRFVFGNSLQNRARWLGNECLYYFRKAS
jgi:2-polyprenyl-3-methyl-5-hydroxy-6-metoxy-1,4-benzoquinol methylase